MKTLKDLEALDIEYNETTTFGNYTITIEQDTNAESPREWDNLGTMVCWHRGYNLGDVNGDKEYSDKDAFWLELSGLDIELTDWGFTEEQRERVMDEAYKKNIILPLYLYDHSGITMNTTGFSCGWDSGQVGYIYMSLEKVRSEYGCKRVSAKMRKRIEGYLTSEVETYDQYLTGEVYGYTLTHTDAEGDEEDLDSCWGYFGYDDTYLVTEIKNCIKWDMEKRPQQLDLLLPVVGEVSHNHHEVS